MLRSLLQRRENASVVKQGCADLSCRSADWRHKIARPPRRTASPLRSDIVFVTHTWLFVRVLCDGIVKLTGSFAQRSDNRDRPASCDEAGVCDLVPGRKGSGARSAMIGGRNSIAGKMEKIGDLIVYRQKFLHLPWRFEPLHDPLSSPRRLMRILRSIVQPLVLAMFDTKAHVLARYAIGFELVCDHDAWRSRGLLRQLSHGRCAGPHLSGFGRGCRERSRPDRRRARANVSCQRS